MRIMTSVCETNGKNCMIFVGIARSKSSVLPTVPFFTKHEGGGVGRPILTAISQTCAAHETTPLIPKHVCIVFVFRKVT